MEKGTLPKQEIQSRRKGYGKKIMGSSTRDMGKVMRMMMLR